MPWRWRSGIAASAASLAMTGALAQAAGDGAEPGIQEKLQAVQVYLEDGSAITMARACAETSPGFMSRFLPPFTNWRAEHSHEITLGAGYSALFKDPKGDAMDPGAVGRAAADKVRAATPEERERTCGDLLKDFIPAK